MGSLTSCGNIITGHRSRCSDVSNGSTIFIASEIKHTVHSRPVSEGNGAVVVHGPSVRLQWT